MSRARRAAGPAPSATALRHLAGAVAHEIRNPLNSMAIHLELLETRASALAAPAGEPVRRSIAALRREVERIDGTLATYLRHAGPPEAERSAVAAADLLTRAAERAGERARGDRVAVSVEAVGLPARWRIDEAAIGHALDLLIDNALDAASRGGRLRLRAEGAGAMAAIEVVDAGEGIAAEDLPRLFLLGFTTRPGRAGLGLTVARQIVKGHGGSVTAHSDGRGRGARLRIELPLE